MKTKLKIIFLCGIIILTAFSCEKEDQYEEILLQYSKCPCDHETEFINSITSEKILLFDSTKTSFFKMKELSTDGVCSRFISYSTELNTASYNSICGAMVYTGYICNFPKIAKDWDVPSKGICISYSADVFELCKPQNSPTTYTYSNLVLTSLKKIEE